MGLRPILRALEHLRGSTSTLVGLMTPEEDQDGPATVTSGGAKGLNAEGSLESKIAQVSATGS